MMKSGISDKTIEDQCDKIGEEEQVSEILEKTEYNIKTKKAKNYSIAMEHKKLGM